MVCIFFKGPVWFSVGGLEGFLALWDELRVRGVSKRTSYDLFDILVCKCVSAHYTRTVGHKLLLSDFLICFFCFLVCKPSR